MALSVNEWAAQIARQVGRAVAHHRVLLGQQQGKKLTAQALADRCAALGLPMDRTVIAKLEKGTRQTITVGELLVLARALEVQPVQLLFPVGREDLTEVLPGTPTDTWAALKWFTGEEDRLPGDFEATASTEAVQLYREHDRLTQEWRKTRRALETTLATMGRPDLRQYRGESDPDGYDARIVELNRQRMRDLEVAIQAVRHELRNSDLKPPAIERELAYINDLEDGSALAAESYPPGLASIPTEPLPPEDGAEGESD